MSKRVLSIMCWLAVSFLTCVRTFADTTQTDTVTVFTIGDSTMANKPTNSDKQERGWGQMLPLHLTGNIKVDNHAANGRSTKSFISEGRWDKVLTLIKPGDYLIIQFGHNDEKAEGKLHTVPGKSFDDNLKRFIREAKKKGAQPILMNSIVRRNYPPTPDTPFNYTYANEGNVLMDTHGEYAVAPRKIAQKEKIPFVDMTSLSYDLVSGLGNERSKDLYMWIPKGKYDFCPNGKIDNTHLRPEGANLMAALAVRGLCEAIPEFSKYVKPEVKWSKDDVISISLPFDARPVLNTATEIFGEDLKRVLNVSAKILPVSCDADVQVCIAPKKIKNAQGFSIRISDEGKVLIDAHDSHGAAYGILELSRLLGVSPWEWWADCNPDAKNEVVIPAYYYVNKAPSVAYRGIFINDEDWGLMPWSYKNFDKQEKGVIGSRTTAKIFELLLRLRANTYWPPMHECSVPFFLTPGNREMAEKYGIYIGGSHCEPMASSTAGEWPRRGAGKYDYMANSENVKSFWKSRIKEVAGQEIIYTLGMRGVHDGAMQGAKGIGQQKEVLNKVLSDQRAMLASHNLINAPQVFIPYKEVLDIYNSGLDVPEDVTLMWCDDNYGYIRHFPDSVERARKGGNGIYYHVSYWGRPHDYLWLGTFSPGLLYQQMSEAYNRGIKKMWILNVGDIKPAEYQIELFMDMAWDMDDVRHLGVERHVENFLKREFGETVGKAMLPVMKEHYRLAFIRKPEFMGNTRTEEKDRAYYNTIRDLSWSEEEIKTRLNSYHAISDSVEKYGSLVNENKHAAFFQLVKYPVQAADQMNRKFLYGQLARHGKADWQLSHAAYDSIQVLTTQYNTPKWSGIMNCHPRKLPVFNKLVGDSVDTTLEEKESFIRKFNGRDGKGFTKSYEWLGYENGAVGIEKGDTLTYSFDGNMPMSAILHIGLLPTHSASQEKQSFQVIVDGNDYGIVDFSTYGRSEEWKENVLRNQAITKTKVNFSPKNCHSIKIISLSDLIIVDQALIEVETD